LKLTVTIDLDAATFRNVDQTNEALDFPLALIGDALDDVKRNLSYDGNNEFAFDRHSNRVGMWKLDPQDWKPPMAATSPAHLHHEGNAR
jgi:hypothetical protein